MKYQVYTGEEVVAGEAQFFEVDEETRTIQFWDQVEREADTPPYQKSWRIEIRHVFNLDRVVYVYMEHGRLPETPGE